MVYAQDNRELRDAREKVYQDQIQEEIAAKEKQIQQKQEEIDLIEKSIEALEKQQDAIDKMIEDTNEYFDKLIEALEDYKDRWQELADLENEAKVMGVLEELGYSTDDILNMSEDAFQAFKGEYLGILKDMNSGNDEFLNQLGKLADVDMHGLPGYLEQTADAVNSMDVGNLDDLKNGLKEVDSALGGGASPATGTSGGGSGASSGGGTGIAGKAKDASLALDEMAKTDTTAISTGLDNLYKTCQNLDLILGKEGNFVEKLLSLGSGEVSLQGLIDQFIALNDAISQVATAIGVGGGIGQATDEAHSFSPNYTGNEGGGEGLLSALEQVNDSDISVITNAFAGEGDEDTTSLLSAVNKVTDAIGFEDSENEEALVPTIMNLPVLTEEPISTLNGWFTDLQGVIADCTTAVNDLASAIANIKMPSFGGGLFGGGGLNGTAYANGNWSAKSKGINGVALTGEVGRELVVDSRSGKWHTVGDRGAEFARIKPNDIVFNSTQTAQLLKKGKINSRGRAYANGNLPEGFAPLSDVENSRFNILSEVKDLAVKLDLGNKTLDSIDKSVEKITTNNTVNNNPVINVNNPTFTCTGVTGEQVLKQIEGSFSGILSRAYQQSMA